MREHPETNKYELLNSSPERVYDFYLNLNDENVWFYCDVIISKETESALLSKDEPLITLALARYCIHKETLVALFKNAMEKNQIALRLACLNRIQKITYDQHNMILPYCLFGSTTRRGTIGNDVCPNEGECNQEIVNWLSSAEQDEIIALFESENISDVFLYKFFNQEQYWDALANRTDWESCIQDIFYYLNENKKIHKGNYLDKNYSTKAWELAKKVDPTAKWALRLSSLYENMEKYTSESFDDSVFERWMKEDEGKALGEELGPFALLRMQLYRNRMCYGPKPKFDLTHPDIANRCAQYQFCSFLYFPFKNLFSKEEIWDSLSPECILEAYEKDGFIACIYLMRNESLWRYKETREVLADVWGKCDNKEKRYVYPDFSQTWDKFEKSNPEWFKEYEPDKKLLTDLTVGDLKDLLDKFKEETIQEINKENWSNLNIVMDVMNKRVD